MIAHAPQFLELIEGSEGIGGRAVRAGEDHLPRHRMQRFRRGGDQRAGGEIALGDPRSLVEQPRRRVERLDVDLHDFGAESGEPRQRRVVGRFRRAIAEEQALTRQRHAELEPVRHRPDCVHRPRPRKRIGRVGTGDHAQHRHRVVDGEREDRDAIERAAGRHDACRGDKTAARLEPDDVAERGGHAAGSGGVGAERERREAGPDRQRRARARTAGNEFFIEQIAADAVGRAHADQAGRELIEIGLAEDERTGLAQPRDTRGIPVGAVAVSRDTRRWSASP